MKKLLNVIFVLLVVATMARAQEPDGMRRIHAAKVAYISNRLHLTPRQSRDFIPLFNDYDNEIRNTRQAFFRKYKDTNPDRLDEMGSRQYIDDNLDYQQQVIQIKRKYNELYLKVLSPQQLAELPRAEREFKQMLMQRLRQQHNGGGRYNYRGNGY